MTLMALNSPQIPLPARVDEEDLKGWGALKKSVPEKGVSKPDEKKPAEKESAKEPVQL